MNGCRRVLYSRVSGELALELPWKISESSVIAQRSVSRFSTRGAALPSMENNSTVLTSRGDINSSWLKGRFNSRAEFPMGMNVERQVGGWRHMGIIERPGDRASQHGVSALRPQADGSPAKIEERRRDEFLGMARKEERAKVMRTEKAVGLVPGESLTAAASEHADKLGTSSVDLQRETAEEFMRRSESSGSLEDGDWAQSTRSADVGKHVDPNGENDPWLDEDVKRGLIADSAFPIGRPEESDEGQKYANLKASARHGGE